MEGEASSVTVGPHAQSLVEALGADCLSRVVAMLDCETDALTLRRLDRRTKEWADRNVFDLRPRVFGTRDQRYLSACYACGSTTDLRLVGRMMVQPFTCGDVWVCTAVPRRRGDGRRLRGGCLAFARRNSVANSVETLRNRLEHMREGSYADEVDPRWRAIARRYVGPGRVRRALGRPSAHDERSYRHVAEWEAQEKRSWRAFRCAMENVFGRHPGGDPDVAAHCHDDPGK